MADRVPRLAWASISETGARAANEDALGHAERAGSTCFVLADGAGGHAAGEVAARLVTDAVTGAFAHGAPLADCARAASAAVAQGRAGNPRYGDMSATLAACIIDCDCTGARAQWAHLGDSRIYLFRQQRVHAVTRDHSLSQQLVDAGLARADQLRVHPQRNILFAAIGAEGDTGMALSEAAALLPGDALLLCSDGLWEWVLEDDMLATLAASSGCADWLRAMCALADAANARSGKARDNYSAYAIQVLEAQA